MDFNALVKCTRVDLATGYEIAQQTDRPHWNKGDFFEELRKARASITSHWATDELDH